MPDATASGGRAVEELGDAPSHRYAGEHTQIESYDGQIENNEQIGRLLLPVRHALEGQLPGTFTLAIRAGEVKLARSKHLRAQEEIIRLIVSAASEMQIDEKRIIRSDSLPFAFGLHRRHALSSQIFIRCNIESMATTFDFFA